MIRVGAVNIDTSHPMGFADSMKKDGRMQYVGVYNDSFRNDKEVEGFIARYGLEKRCLSIEELAEMCDIGFIQLSLIHIYFVLFATSSTLSLRIT